jgi:hypothetical protein
MHCLRRGLCVIAALALASASATTVQAARLPARRAASHVSARHRALEAFRRDRRTHDRSRRAARRSAARARAAVVGGSEAQIEQVPWQVIVVAEYEIEGEMVGTLCGGSLVDMSHVVTAGHCALNASTRQRLNSSSFVVIAGASKFTEQEIRNGPTVQARSVELVRVHPYFDPRAGAGGPDDVAVLNLAEALLPSTAVTPIAIAPTTPAPVEGDAVTVSGFGEEDGASEELNGRLYTLGTTLLFPRRCGGEADALLLCASTSSGTICSGDSGGPLTEEVDGSPALVGIVDTYTLVEGQRCRPGAVDGFADVTAPEVRGFIEGREHPPLAPRGGGVAIHGVPVSGSSLNCESGSWSNSPTFSYAFIDSHTGQVLREGSSSRYLLSAADVGRSILCEVRASNAGGTGVSRTGALGPIQPAPVPSVPQGTSAAQGVTPAPVPSTGSSSVSSAQIAAALRQALVLSGQSASIARLLRSAFTVAFHALEPGTAEIDWYRLPPGAKLAMSARAAPILVASARMKFASSGTARLKIKLTGAGRRLLAHAKRLNLTAKATFTPRGGAPVIVVKTLTLRR